MSCSRLHHRRYTEYGWIWFVPCVRLRFSQSYSYFSQQFKGSVKARQLVLALREYYWEQLHPSTTSSSSRPNSPALGTPISSLPRIQVEAPTPAILASDEWTLRYINIVRIQPLIEAFDDDASGFITVREANQFTRMRLPDWRFVFNTFHVLQLRSCCILSVPQWIAYWAAGKSPRLLNSASTD